MTTQVPKVGPLVSNHSFLQATSKVDKKNSLINLRHPLVGIISLIGPTIPLLMLLSGSGKVDKETEEKNFSRSHGPIPILIKDADTQPIKSSLSNEQSKYINPYDAANELRKIKGFAHREDYLKRVLKQINPELLPSIDNSNEETALAIFNKKHSTSFICMGIKKVPYEFVFIDENYFLGKSPDPIRIAVTLSEAEYTQGRENIVSLLDHKLKDEKQKLSEQYNIWAKPYKYDFEKNGKTVLMMALALSNLSGMESDFVRELEIYNKIYKMPVEALCIQDAHITRYQKELQGKNFEDLPLPAKATKSEILEKIESVLKKAIDGRKEKVMIHLMAHGSDDGNLWAEDGAIKPDEIGNVLSKTYNGKPLCEQLEVTIWIGNCYSGRHLDGLKSYFEGRRDIGVRNLRVIAESNYTLASAGLTPDDASLISDLMIDKSGPLDYYSSWYRECLDYIKKKYKNQQIKEPAGTFLHQIRFGDLLSRYDSPWQQDAQGFHYYNDPSTGRRDGQTFTRNVGG